MKWTDSRADVEREAARGGARRAASLTDDGRRRRAGGEPPALLRERRGEVLAANQADVEAAPDRLDEGTLDRLRLDDATGRTRSPPGRGDARLSTARARDRPPGRCANGLGVSERRIPIGTVGANFEARPNVALDVAGQLLKSLNAGVLRTGGAALRTVTVLVDDVLRPALEDAGLPPERGRARALAPTARVRACSSRCPRSSRS